MHHRERAGRCEPANTPDDDEALGPDEYGFHGTGAEALGGGEAPERDPAFFCDPLELDMARDHSIESRLDFQSFRIRRVRIDGRDKQARTLMDGDRGVVWYIDILEPCSEFTGTRKPFRGPRVLVMVAEEPGGH